MRGGALLPGLLALAALACAGAMAQDHPLGYPMRPVRMVKPFAPDD